MVHRAGWFDSAALSDPWRCVHAPVADLANC